MSSKKRAPMPEPPNRARRIGKKANAVNELREHSAPGADIETQTPKTERRFSHSGLTPLEHRFTQEYISDLNGTQAYLRVSPEVSQETAATNAARMLRNARVESEVQRLLDQRSVATGITAERVLVHLWNQATADPRELTEMRVGSCRHCHGTGFGYQRTPAEFARDQARHIAGEIKRERAMGKDYEPTQFDDMGGIGFNPNKDPHPDCPECFGHGEERAIIKDTRYLSPQARLLFAGVERTKDGAKIKMHDQQRAMELVGRNLGMWNDKLKVSGDAENPLVVLLQQIASSQGVTLPMVEMDPETANSALQDVQDVEVKPKATEKKALAWQPIKKRVT